MDRGLPLTQLRPLLCSGPADSRWRTAGFFLPPTLPVLLPPAVRGRYNGPAALGHVAVASPSRNRSLTMLSQESVCELRTKWLPNITDAGLDRLIGLLEQGSPLLVHGCFTRAPAMG